MSYHNTNVPFLLSLLAVNGHATRTTTSSRVSSAASNGPSRPRSSGGSVAPTSRPDSAATSSRQVERIRESAPHASSSRADKPRSRLVEREVEVEVVIADQEEEAGPSTGTASLRALDGVPLEVQEAWICEDMMFVLQVSFERGWLS